MIPTNVAIPFTALMLLMVSPPSIANENPLDEVQGWLENCIRPDREYKSTKPADAQLPNPGPQMYFFVYVTTDPRPILNGGSEYTTFRIEVDMRCLWAIPQPCLSHLPQSILDCIEANIPIPPCPPDYQAACRLILESNLPP